LETTTTTEEPRSRHSVSFNLADNRKTSCTTPKRKGIVTSPQPPSSKFHHRYTTSLINIAGAYNFDIRESGIKGDMKGHYH
jgi:hypothetical protein